MISDARLLDDDIELSADICIVGAGAAGITLALALRGSGLKVLLLESGGLDADVALQDFYVGQQTGISTWKLNEERFRGFGGSTALWGGFCRPLSPEDFTQRSYVAGSGWPIAYEDILPYYQRACDTLGIGTFDYDPAKLAGRVGLPLLPVDPGILETRVYRFSTVRFAERFRADLDADSDSTTLLYSNLLGVRLTGPGGDVSHLDCATLGGTRFTVTADTYVLALGGIENARLLLASNTEQPEGVANGSGLVGTFLEHPHYYGLGAIVWSAPPDLRFYTQHDAPAADDGTATVPMQGAIALSAATRAAAQLPSFTAMLESAPYPFDTATPVTPAVASALLPDAAPGWTPLTLRCEQTFSDNGRLSLIDDVDALGMRRLALDWVIRDADMAALQQSALLLGKEIGRSGLGRLRLPPAGPAWYPSPGGHHLGTARMSADSAAGVVDSDLRAHDVENLYVIGSSSFASGGDANPTLTIVALTHRLADHLRGVTP